MQHCVGQQILDLDLNSCHRKTRIIINLSSNKACMLDTNVGLLQTIGFNEKDKFIKFSPS